MKQARIFQKVLNIVNQDVIPWHKIPDIPSYYMIAHYISKTQCFVAASFWYYLVSLLGLLSGINWQLCQTAFEYVMSFLKAYLFSAQLLFNFSMSSLTLRLQGASLASYSNAS